MLFRPYLEDLCTVFAKGTDEHSGRISSHVETCSRKNDILQLRNLLQEFLSKIEEKHMEENFTSFVKICAKVKSVEELAEHPFIRNGIFFAIVSFICS